MATKTYIAALEKWEKLEDGVRRECARLSEIPNPTAEQYGEWSAYSNILIRMDDLQAVEKKLDKA